MINLVLFLTLFFLSLIYFYLGYKKAAFISKNKEKINSLPYYHGLFNWICCFIPAFLIFSFIIIFDDIVFKNLILNYVPSNVLDKENFSKLIIYTQIRNAADGIFFGTPASWLVSTSEILKYWYKLSFVSNALISVSLLLLLGIISYKKINADFKARLVVEKSFTFILALISLIAILTTLGIVLSVVFESLRFFSLVPVSEFLFGLTWNPQFEGAERAGSGQMGLAQYGSLPLFIGTLLISIIALLVSIPIGLYSAIYLSEYASKFERSIFKPLLEILAGIPTVVYGFFAALTIAPMLRNGGSVIGLDIASESALAAGFVMGIMIIPFVSSLSDDVINAVPQSLRDAGFGLGATKNEVIFGIVLPAALPGITASFILAISRAIGETMIVVMAAGLAANLSINPFDAVTTVTSQIVTILVGDQEFESAKTLSAFALALTLIVITLILNFYALFVVKKYREKYE